MIKKKTEQEEQQFKNAEEFSKKMVQERLEKKKKEQEKRKKLTERIRRQEEEFLKKQKENEEKKKAERRERLLKIKEKEEGRKRQILESQVKYKTNLKKLQKPLYMKIEKQFEDQFIIPELEKRKKELAAKRSFMKPIDGSEILNHEKRYESILKQESAKRANKFKVDTTYDPSKYHTKFLDEVLDYDSRAKQEEEQKTKEISALVSKKKNYSKLVMETHKPSVSKKKQMEMELIRQNLDQPTAFERMKKRMVSSSQNRNKSYKKLGSSIAHQSDGERSSRKPRKAKDFDWRSMNRFVGVSYIYSIS